jgi:gamma-glutamyl-gamma-aminobutyrate hydrolase PuuD|tara:strand:- start:2387 stop:3010 length:624 start_codon:yes stop_codon:yes gene_type:complete
MKKIAVTQRVIEESAYKERRDALDQRWVNFLLSIGFYPVLIPNHLEFVKKIVNESGIRGVLLTGGNSLCEYGGDAPERDQVEAYLLQWSLENAFPVLGVCRGMQLIQNFFGNKLGPVTGHVGARHELLIPENTRLSSSLDKLGKVNSYHEYGTKVVSGEIDACAYSKDGVVMAIEHRSQDIYGVMWHSEREEPFVGQEQEIFNFIFR